LTDPDMPYLPFDVNATYFVAAVLGAAIESVAAYGLWRLAQAHFAREIDSAA
jgi:hypothetical protein